MVSPELTSTALAKIPLIILVTLAYRIAYTPPQPLPSELELEKTAKLDGTFRRWRYIHLTFVRGSQVVLGIMEIVLILCATPSPINPSFGRGVIDSYSNVVNSDRLRMTPLAAFGAILILVGALLRMQTYRQLGRFFRFEISIQNDHELITTGPYSYVRHPAYTGILFIAVGWLCWNWAPGSLLREIALRNTTFFKAIVASYVTYEHLLPVVRTFSRMSREDEILRNKFGEKWDIWARKVPYFVLPGIY